MDKEQKPRLIDSLPLKQYTIATSELENCEVDELINVVKVQDVENFLQKFTDPAVLNKIVKSLMFGQKLDFKDIIK